MHVLGLEVKAGAGEGEGLWSGDRCSGGFLWCRYLRWRQAGRSYNIGLECDFSLSKSYFNLR